MTGFNLPPGCSESDIPGNRPEDAAWEKFHESIDDKTSELGIDVDDAYFIWQAGLDVYQHALQYARKTLRSYRESLEES